MTYFNQLLTYIPEYSNANIDYIKCKDIVYNSNSLNDVRNYVNSIYNKLLRSEQEVINEALNVTIPIIYRLSLDDSSNNYRIASAIRNKAFKLLYPKFYDALIEEIDYLCYRYFNCSYDSLNTIINDISSQYEFNLKNSNLKYIIYFRLKSPLSIFDKLYKYYENKKDLKISDNNITNELNNLLNTFSLNVLNRMLNKNVSTEYGNSNILLWALPDLIAFTIQFDQDFIKGKNLGVAKNKYKSVYNKIFKITNSTVYYGPSFSEKWYMNRLYFYSMLLQSGNKIPYETFIRTNYDYYIGYSYYNRYKNISLLIHPKEEQKKYKIFIVNNIKHCSKFEEVQELLYKEINNRDWLLF